MTHSLALRIAVHRTVIALVTLAAFTGELDAQQPGDARLKTRWAAEVTPDDCLAEYPRPQMRRAEWQNLNGHWEYAIRPRDQQQPGEFDGEILVPFPVESLLSGVQRPVGADNRLWYRRAVEAPAIADERLLLHFGAVDWHATVWVNGHLIGEHQGGYDPFTFDITDAAVSGENEIVVAVWDPTDEGFQPRGKQIRRPHGIWYTAVTGIWQTVWLEKVPQNYVESLKITPRAAESQVDLQVNVAGHKGADVVVIVKDGGQEVATAETTAGATVSIEIPNAKLWSPASPHLYDLVVETSNGDRVESYFGLRDITIAKDDKGVTRMMLNGEPLFQYGLLDQGWWPDGLYTAPTDEALRYDVEVTKKLGFNMIRKHVKVEPARWYYWCDKLGLLVWQDMPSGDKYISGNAPDIVRTDKSGKNFEHELREMIHDFHNFPCIVMWVPFNEGWGQWDTQRICALVKEWDPTRLINNASGWTDRGVGDVHDIHRYPGPAMPPLEEDRAAVLGEFGGLGLAISGHTWQDEKNWGYRSYKTKEELNAAYRRLIMHLRFLVSAGLSAAVYTQTTDVEIEVNGLLTYDRQIIKLPAEVAELHEMLYGPVPSLEPILETSEGEPQKWRYTTDDPGADWMDPSYDDSEWKTGEAGFGGNRPPGVMPKTAWTGSDIWLRRTVTLDAQGAHNPMLRIYHDENATVYFNGEKVASLTGYTTSYELVPLDAAARRHFEADKLTIAVHCLQTQGGQYIDLGIVDVVPPGDSD